MRRIIYTAAMILMVISSLSLVGCRDDLSSMDLNKIVGVNVDTTGQASLNIFQFDHLVIKPKLTGNTSTDLSYEWKINLQPGSLSYLVIGDKKDLDYEVTFTPTIGDQKHQVVLAVTDNKTGLEYLTAWPLVIRNSIGEGLVIAETSDGINSDISHIMSPLVTPLYTTESVKHRIFSTINGEQLPGVIKQLKHTRIKGLGQAMMAITEKSFLTIKTLDYTLGATNQNMFFSDFQGVKPQALGELVQSDVFIGNNKLYATWLAIGQKFGVPFDSPFSVPSQIALNRNNNYPDVTINFYDEVHGHFVSQSSVQSFGDRKMYKSKTGGPFNAGDLPNKVNLAAGVTLSADFLHVLKDKSSGAVGLYILDGGRRDENSNLVMPIAKAFFDLSTAPDINNAVHFVVLNDQNVLYYATKTKIYAVLFGTSVPTFSDRYTAAAGEEITTLQIYQQWDYPSRSGGDFIATNNKQLIMSTYKGTEGKVYILPMINVGVGNIDLPKVKSYGGFGRITAIATQQ